jgi:hypothetical protein
VGPVYRHRCSRARPLALSAPPTPLVSTSLTSRPRSPCRGHAHVRAFSGHDRSPAALLNLVPCSPISPLPFPPSAQLSHSLSLCSRESRTSATARRRPPRVPWPPLRPRPIQCHSEPRLPVNFSGHPSVCPFPSWFCRSTLTRVVLAQLVLRHRRPVASLCLRRCPCLQRSPAR